MQKTPVFFYFFLVGQIENIKEMLQLVFLVFISLVIIKIVTIQYINSQMWDIIDDCYIRNLTKNQVCAVFHSPIIPRKYLYLPHGRKFSQHLFTPLEIPSTIHDNNVYWQSSTMITDNLTVSKSKEGGSAAAEEKDVGQGKCSLMVL